MAIDTNKVQSLQIHHSLMIQDTLEQVSLHQRVMQIIHICIRI